MGMASPHTLQHGMQERHGTCEWDRKDDGTVMAHIGHGRPQVAGSESFFEVVLSGFRIRFIRLAADEWRVSGMVIYAISGHTMSMARTHAGAMWFLGGPILHLSRSVCMFPTPRKTHGWYELEPYVDDQDLGIDTAMLHHRVQDPSRKVAVLQPVDSALNDSFGCCVGSHRLPSIGRYHPMPCRRWELCSAG